MTPTVRPNTTALFYLRVFQLGLKYEDLFEMTEGEVIDMMTESANDKYPWEKKATQEDFDNFFH